MKRYEQVMKIAKKISEIKADYYSVMADHYKYVKDRNGVLPGELFNDLILSLHDVFTDLRDEKRVVEDMVNW